MIDTDAPTAPKRAVLSKELSEFLVELSIGVHRFAMYPPGHPSLSPVVESVMRRLYELFAERRSLSIGVAQRHLVIEGVATDQRHALLSDLARRLHDHQLGAVTFESGIDEPQVAGVLKALAMDAERGGTPLGLLAEDAFPRWEHASVSRVGYERLELAEEAGEELGHLHRATALWVGLAKAALGDDAALPVTPDATAVAQGIRAHRVEDAYDQVVVGYLLNLASELKGRRGQESEIVRRRVSKLITELDDDTLSRLVQFGGNSAKRKRFLLDANQCLAVDSVVKLLEAAASTPALGISHSMTRLLNKLAVHAERGNAKVGPQADTALREGVEALVHGWDLEDPNPDAYTNVLDGMSRAAPIFHRADEGEGSLAGAQRLLEMALEVDAYGPVVAKALTDVLAAGGVGTILALLREVDPSTNVSGRIRSYLTSPDRFRDLMAGGLMDDGALRVLVEEMGPAAVDPLLDVLGDSDSRAVRRSVFDSLVEMGPFAALRAVERLGDPRWFVVRNMLSLLQRIEHLPEDFDAQRFVEHEDPRVRREAFPLALRESLGRERVLALGLADPDERVVRMALVELQGDIPDGVLPTLVNRVVLSGERPAALRTLGVKALARSPSPLALSTLLTLCTTRRTLFARVRLANPTPEGLAALRALASGWGERDEVKPVLAQAHRSKDVNIRRAVSGGMASDKPAPGGTP